MFQFWVFNSAYILQTGESLFPNKVTGASSRIPTAASCVLPVTHTQDSNWKQ